MSKTRILLSALLLAGLAIIGYSRFQAQEAEDCPITVVVPKEGAVPNENGIFIATAENTTTLCFDTPAQAARYRTDGALDFPDDVDAEVLESAEREYYDSLSTSHN